MIKRRYLLSALLGVSANAQTKDYVNGECPVCHFVAEPFVIDLKAGLPKCAPAEYWYGGDNMPMIGPSPTYRGPHTEGVDCSNVEHTLTLPYDQREVVCKRCSNTFVQKAIYATRK